MPRRTGPSTAPALRRGFLREPHGLHTLSLVPFVVRPGQQRGTGHSTTETLRDRAWEAIEAAGIVHRDPKPLNVLLGPDGPKVIDFGMGCG